MNTANNSDEPSLAAHEPRSAVRTRSRHAPDAAPPASAKRVEGGFGRRERRAWWLMHARYWLAIARTFRLGFGGHDHYVRLGWYLDALLRADRYREWARTRLA